MGRSLLVHFVTSVSLVVACRTEPPIDPELEDQIVRATRERRKATEERDQAAAAAVAAQASRSAVESEIASLTEVENSAYVSRSHVELAVERYAKSLREAAVLATTCKDPDADRVLAVHSELIRFRSSPDRDEALAKLEPCRLALVKQSKQIVKQTAQDLRQEFAVTVEENFDENNRYRRGDLTARVIGTTLQVRMDGNFGGRPRHSQEQVDTWCARTIVFSKIVLRNKHGTFSCDPDFDELRSATDERLRVSGLDTPWTNPASGATEVPSLTDRPSVPNHSDAKTTLSQQAAALQGPLVAADEVLARAETKVRRAHAEEIRLTEERDSSAREWRDGVTRNARNLQIAGAVIAGMGGVSIAIGAIMGTQRTETKTSLMYAKAQEAIGGQGDVDGLESKLARQTLVLTVGLAIGIPLVATGIALAIGGKKRGDAVRVAATPSGIAVRF